MSYGKPIGACQVMLMVSSDVDMSDVIYGINIEGIKIAKCSQIGVPVTRITFN